MPPGGKHHNIKIKFFKSAAVCKRRLSVKMVNNSIALLKNTKL